MLDYLNQFTIVYKSQYVWLNKANFCELDLPRGIERIVEVLEQSKLLRTRSTKRDRKKGRRVVVDRLVIPLTNTVMRNG